MIFNHIIHHRAQLTVYYRLLGVPVPALRAERRRNGNCRRRGFKLIWLVDGRGERRSLRPAALG